MRPKTLNQSAFQPAEHKRDSDDRDNTETDKDRREKCASEIQSETNPDGKGKHQEVQDAARGVNIGSRFERFRRRRVSSARFGLVCSIGLPYGLLTASHRPH
jgi:hypothetical protein